MSIRHWQPVDGASRSKSKQVDSQCKTRATVQSTVHASRGKRLVDFAASGWTTLQTKLEPSQLKQVKASQASVFKSRQIKSRQAKVSQSRSQAKAIPSKSKQAKASQGKSKQVKTSQRKSRQVNASQDKSTQG